MQNVTTWIRERGKQERASGGAVEKIVTRDWRAVESGAVDIKRPVELDRRLRAGRERRAGRWKGRGRDGAGASAGSRDNAK